MFKTIVAIAGLLILANLNAQAEQLATRNVKAKTMTLPDAIEYVRPSVIQMTMMLDNFSGSAVAAFGGKLFVAFPLGTGFLVNEDGYVVTALHVVRAFQAYQVEGRKRLLVGVAAPNSENIRGNFAQIEFDIVEEDAGHDLVLLKLKRNPFKGEIGIFMKTGDKSIEWPHKAVILSRGRPRDGEIIAVSGYPLSSTVLITTSGDMSPVIYGDGNHEPASAGNRPLSYNSGLSVVVPIRYVIDLLKKHDLKWAEAAS